MATETSSRPSKVSNGRPKPDGHPSTVLFVTRKWPPAMGGMETWSRQLSSHLAQLTSLDLIALQGRKNGMPPTVFALMMFPFTVLFQRFRVKHRPDLIILGDMAIWPLAFLLWPFNSQIRLLIGAHGTDVAFHRRGGPRGKAYGAYLRMGARLLKNAQIIANSSATQKILRETGWTNTSVIPLAAEFAESQPKNSGDGASRALLFAGRLVERKGCGWFVRNVLPKLPPDITLKIAGTGWDEQEKFVLNHPMVEYLGQLDRDELAQAYADALCVIIPNIEPASGEYEGFGLVAVEAAGAGAMVLAADHGGLRDAVIDGQTGHLIATGDADAWVIAIDRITKLSADERAAFCSSARGVAREYFNWGRVAREVLALGAARD